MNSNVLVCPHCSLLNNVMQNELEGDPICNDCKSSLLPNEAIDADTELFLHLISHSTLPVVVNFWGTWSGISHEMSEVEASLAQTFKQDALFVRVNCEQEQVLCNSYRLLDIPTFIMLKSGIEYRRIHGLVTEREFHRWLERYLRVKRKKAVKHHSSV